MRFDSDSNFTYICLDSNQQMILFIYLGKPGCLYPVHNWRREYQSFQARIDWFLYGPRQIGSEGATRSAMVTVKASLISSLPFFHVSLTHGRMVLHIKMFTRISTSALVWFGPFWKKKWQSPAVVCGEFILNPVTTWFSQADDKFMVHSYCSTQTIMDHTQGSFVCVSAKGRLTFFVLLLLI